MSMRVIHNIPELREALSHVKNSGQTIGFVPTMGALHAGHGRLMEQAAAESDCVVVSIFVNAIQFNQQADYQRYPRTLATDFEFCSARDVDIVFAPSEEEVYPRPQLTFVDVERVSTNLCGHFRPGHFRGVATVVLKLFNMVEPNRAYFGEKDAQQLAVIRRMCTDLDVPVTIVGVPTVREPDGLALSSRNRHLTPEERSVATVLYQALQTVARQIEHGETSIGNIKNQVSALFARYPMVRLEYLEIVDPDEMQPVEQVSGPVRAVGAMWIGATRLIDNVLCKPLPSPRS
jgi:pantoate--beta-alanine ligase